MDISIKSQLPKKLLCFSHLRWDFVFQRPQHIMSRFAAQTEVYYMEEPIFDAAENVYLQVEDKPDGITLLIPHLNHNQEHATHQQQMKMLLENFLEGTSLSDWTFWYYTPMALTFSADFSAALTVFDCMDELSAFDFAPPELLDMERKLLKTSDIVFTGGHSLHEAKKNQHHNIHVFPSSIDKKHFGKGRVKNQEPADQAVIKGPKLGFFGVIDERFDVELIQEIAVKRPDWQIILLGPVVKISQDSLPVGENIHFLGQKSYSELPAYLSGWDIALIPFAINHSTRFISPTKTPEYLAAGVQVVSTPIRDVVNPYGVANLVSIAADSNGFIEAIEQKLKSGCTPAWKQRVDQFLKDKSWDHTFNEMQQKMTETLITSDKLLAS